MHYKVVVFGVKDTSENIIEFIRQELCPVDLIITIAPKVLEHNQVSGFKGLRHFTDDYGIPVFEADSYFLTDEKTKMIKVRLRSGLNKEILYEAGRFQRI